MKAFILTANFLISIALAQNTGIGTTTPTEKLHVDSGNIKIGSLPWKPGKTHLLKFGDLDNVHIGEVGNDSLELKATNFSFRTAGTNTNLDLFGSLHVNGSLYIIDSTQSAGKVLTCDAAGKTSWCSLPSCNGGFYITKTAVQQISPDIYTQVNFDSVIYDDTNAFGGSIFKVPADGVYHFDVKLLYNLNAVTSRYAQILGFFVDDEEISRTHQLVEAGANWHNTIEFSTDYKLSAGQAVTVYTYQDSGITQVIMPLFNFFCGHRVY